MRLDYNGPSLSSYDSAHKAWYQADRWRGENGEHDARKLDGRKRHVNIRMLPNRDIACRLHSTDVVVYHTDNSITIERWGSVSTDAFAASVLPASMHPTFNTEGCDLWIAPRIGSCYLWDRENPWQGWKFDRGVCTFKRTEEGDDFDWAPADLNQTAPIEHSYLDAKAGAAARKKYRWNDFMAWYKGWCALRDVKGQPLFALGSCYNNRDEILATLVSGEWTKFFDPEKVASQYIKGYDPLHQIKTAMYQAEEAVVTEELQYVLGLHAMRNINQSSSRW